MVRCLPSASTISTVSIVPPISAREQTSVSSDLVTAAWLMPVTSMKTRVVPCFSFVSSLLMMGGIERTWFLRIDKNGVAFVIREKFGVGDAFGVRFEDLPAGHFFAGHTEGSERFFIGVDRAVGDVAADRGHVVDADRGQLAVAADAPVEVLLQLHDGDQARFVDGRQRHHGAGDKRAVARFVGDRFVDLHREAGRFGGVFWQARFDTERAAEGAGEAADVEQVGAIGQEVEPHDLLVAGAFERRFRFEAADGADFYFVLAERVLDQRAALRAAAAFDVDDVFHVATDLLERFAERFRWVRFAQEAVEPGEVDVDYGHGVASGDRGAGGRGVQGRKSPSEPSEQLRRLQPCATIRILTP